MERNGATSRICLPFLVERFTPARLKFLTPRRPFPTPNFGTKTAIQLTTNAGQIRPYKLLSLALPSPPQARSFWSPVRHVPDKNLRQCSRPERGSPSTNSCPGFTNFLVATKQICGPKIRPPILELFNYCGVDYPLSRSKFFALSRTFPGSNHPLEFNLTNFEVSHLLKLKRPTFLRSAPTARAARSNFFCHRKFSYPLIPLATTILELNI